MELARKEPNVNVTLVMPSVVTTDFAKNVVGEPKMPAPGRAAAAQTPEEVAKIIVGVIREPVPEIYTNSGSPAIAKAYQEDIAAFEAKLRPS
jgi:short-subunit dehydrogenase